jgi:hypothetical protein
MRYLIIAICIVLGLQSCSREDAGWKTHAINEGNFTIDMPSPVIKADKVEETVFGKKTRHLVSWKPSSFAIDKFKLFEVSYIDCPLSLSSDTFKMNNALDEAVEMRKKDFSEVEVLESQAIEFNGYPGRAFFYDDPKGNTLVSVKICMAGDRIYDLVVIAKKNYAINDDMDRFFNSFKLIR